MLKYLIDTDHLSVYARKQGSAYARLKAKIAQVEPTEIGVAIISFHEQAIGCHSYLQRAKNAYDLARGYLMFQELLGAFSSANVVPFSAVVANRFLGLRSQLSTVSTNDLRIAAVALEHGLTLVTGNTVDFQKVPGLRLDNWLD